MTGDDPTAESDADSADEAGATDPADDTDSSAADWGIAPRRSRMESNTKFGLALIVLLVGTLGFVVWKKMERRRADEAAAQGEQDTTGRAGRARVANAPSDDDGSARHANRLDGDVFADATGRARGVPPQSEPPLEGDDADGASRSTADRGAAEFGSEARFADRSQDVAHQHPLRRLDSHAEVLPGEPSPFGAHPSAASADPATSGDASAGDASAGDHTSATATAAATQNPFADPAPTGSVRIGSADTSQQTAAAENAATDASSTADWLAGQQPSSTADGTTSVAAGSGAVSSSTPSGPDEGVAESTGADAESADAPWTTADRSSARSTTEIEIRSTPAVTAAVPVSHDVPWSPQSTATHAIGEHSAEAPPFSPVQAPYDVPHSTAPAPTAVAAEESPWSATPSGTGAATTENPFTSSAAQSASWPSAAGSSSSAATSSAAARPHNDDLSGFAGAAGPSAEDRPAVYTVRSGDSYWRISRNQYGTGRYYRALALYNAHRIRDARQMRKGMQVLIPDRQILDSRFAHVLPKPATAARPPGLFHGESGEVLYRVGRGDTLGGIAQRHLGRAARWTEILRLNQQRLTSPGALKAGMELRLPADASRVRLVSEAAEGR